MKLKKVPESRRMTFYPKNFRTIFTGLEFESLCFSIARKMLNGYNGGSWVFYEVTNSNAVMIAPEFDGITKFINHNNYLELDVDMKQAGIIISLYALANVEEPELYQELYKYASTVFDENTLYKILD